MVILAAVKTEGAVRAGRRAGGARSGAQRGQKGS